MPELDLELSRFLAEHFPSLTFPRVTARPGIFPSLRFELGGGLPTGNDDARDKRAAHSARLAVSIFESAFQSEDDGFVSFTSWKPTAVPRFLALLPGECEITRTEGQDFYEQNEPDTPYVRHTARLRPRSLDYPRLFELVAGRELLGRRSPSFDGRCYLVNTSTPMVFHMYDDRGAMIVAAQDADLDRLRARFADEIIP